MNSQRFPSANCDRRQALVTVPLGRYKRTVRIETVVQFSDAPPPVSQMSMSARANLPEDVFVDLRDDMNVRIAGLGDVVAHGVRENGCNFGRIQTVVNRKSF